MSNAPPSLSPPRRSAIVKQAAADAGFDACGIAAAGPIAHAAYLRDWLASGRAGTMRYLGRHAASREDVRAWLPWARSVIVTALNYHQPPPEGATIAGEPRGRVAMYARGRDYHDVMKQKLADLLDRLRAAWPGPFQTKVCVDTSAVCERELAAAAGLGWIGKNTMVLHPALGSFFVLGEIVTDLELAADQPLPDHCGACTRCLEACPTRAFPAAHEMDASRCISYLTIEHRGPIEPALAADMGDWVFGCDVCQEVCPFNQKAPPTREPRLIGTADSARPPLTPILSWTGASHRAATAQRATARATTATWRRNARIAMENLARERT